MCAGGEKNDFQEVFGGRGVAGVSGQEGTWEPWPEDGSQPTPSEVSML